MLNIDTINEFFKDYKIPNKTTPVLKWTKKKPSKKEIEDRGFSPDDEITMFFNMYTGVLGYSLSEVINDESKANVFDKTSRDEIRYYCEYIPELDGFVLGSAKLNLRAVNVSDVKEYHRLNEKLKKDDISFEARCVAVCNISDLKVIRHWEKNGEIFIGKNKEVVYAPHTWESTFNEETDHWIYSWKGTGPMLIHDKLEGDSPFKLEHIGIEKVGLDNENIEDLVEPLLSVFPRICNVGGNKVVDITENGLKLKTFLKYKEPKKKTSAKQKKIDELVALPLDEITYDSSYNYEMAFIQKVKPGMCVLRTMRRDDSNKIMVDGARIYVTKKDTIACRPTNNNEWVDMRLNCNGIHWNFALDKFDLDIVKGTKLEYFGSIVDEVPTDIKGMYIWSLLTYPIVEQISKAGMRNVVLSRLNFSNYENLLDELSKFFGEINEGRTLPDKLGINKYQLKQMAVIMDSDWYIKNNNPVSGFYNYHLFTPLSYMKDIFEDKLKDIDNDTFDLILKVFVDAHHILEDRKVLWESWEHKSIFEYLCKIFKLLKDVYSISTLKRIAPTCLLLVHNACDIEIKRKKLPRNEAWKIRVMDIFHFYRDYLYTVAEMKDTSHFKADFDPKNLESIKDMHDLASDVYQIRKDELNYRKFAEQAEKWNKWEYEGENYSVIAPKMHNEIAREGLELRHCVKSYIPRVIDGITNILFIRENSNLKKPFFTIEVSNDGTIEQVHGACNRNVDTEPGLEDFIKEWKKARKMKLSNFDKIR